MTLLVKNVQALKQMNVLLVMKVNIFSIRFVVQVVKMDIGEKKVQENALFVTQNAKLVLVRLK